VFFHRPLTEGIKFRNLVTVFEFCGGIRDTETSFSLSTQGFCCQYRSTCPPHVYLLIVFVLFVPKGQRAEYWKPSQTRTFPASGSNLIQIFLSVLKS